MISWKGWRECSGIIERGGGGASSENILRDYK